MTRAEIASAYEAFENIRKAYETSCIVVSIGARGPSLDCTNGNAIATVTVGMDTATSEAVHLDDAIHLARAKCVSAAEARKAEAEGLKKQRRYRTHKLA